MTPPWCGVSAPDAAQSLPDGSLPTHPVGSFPHIPYYAIGCTLDAIAARSHGRMAVEVVGRSALGRELYVVTINALDTAQQRKDFRAWQQVRKIAMTDPDAGQDLLARYGDKVKVPLFIQAGIHGNEYEGVDASFQVIEKLATTAYGADPEIDEILDHAVVVFNVIQNPDGRVAGTRANGNGFNLNRDYLTQSQPEPQAGSVALSDRYGRPPQIFRRELPGDGRPSFDQPPRRPMSTVCLAWIEGRSKQKSISTGRPAGADHSDGLMQQSPFYVQATGSRVYPVVTTDGVGVVSHAGTALLAELADRVGLTAAYGEAMYGTRRRSGGHDPGRVLVDLAVAIADGAETITDLRALSDQELLHGPVASTATAWRVLDSVDSARLSALRSARAAARERAWLARGELTGTALPPARAGGRELTELVIDVDATLIDVHSDKEGASGNFKGGFGYQCAMRRSVIYPAQPGGTWKEVSGSDDSP